MQSEFLNIFSYIQNVIYLEITSLQDYHKTQVTNSVTFSQPLTLSKCSLTPSIPKTPLRNVHEIINDK